MIQPASSAEVTFPIASLERRFTAFAVDRLLAWSCTAGAGVATWYFLDDDPWLVVGVMAGALVLIGIVVAVVAGKTGATPGKAVAGLRIVHHGTGTPIGVFRSLLRTAMLGLSALPTFAIGVATMAWTAVEDRGRQRRGWHDHVCASVVVDVRPSQDATDLVLDEAPRHIVNLTAMRLVPAPAIDVPATPERTKVPERVPAPERPATPARAFAPPPSPQAPAPQAPAPQAPSLPQAPQPPAPPRASAPGRVSQPVPSRASAPPVPLPPRPAPIRWRVVFDDGEALEVNGIVLVGRKPEARQGEVVAHLVPLASADMSISKTHAQFGTTPDGTLLVMDRGSTNGTLLIRRGVTRKLTPGRPAALQPGDRVQFGDRSMSVEGDT